MWTFLGRVMATFFGLTLFFGVIFLLLVAVGLSLTSDSAVSIEPNTVLRIDLNGQLMERSSEDPLRELGLTDEPAQLGLAEIKEAIRAAKTDPNMAGIHLHAQATMSGLASLSELRQSLVDFKESGKFVVAYGEFFTELSYYLVSVADEIHLHPQGFLEFNGFSSQSMFLKGTLDKLEVEPIIFRVGEYKSAIEPLIRTDLSEENRHQRTALLRSLYDGFIQEIAVSRSLSETALRLAAGQMQARNADSALSLGLITHISYWDQFEGAMKLRADSTEDAELETVSLNDYLSSLPEEKVSANRVAVLVASGDIVSGKGDENSIGADLFIEELKKLREESHVKAIVLRINSPGGSALASDALWREIQLTREKKPVYASMSDVAASGGYYMAMACDSIWAQPQTITGSIGIFGVLFNTEKLFKNKLGITFDGVKTGDYANIFDLVHPLSEAEKAIIQQSVNEGYETFTRKAALGRNMSHDELKKYASGRVWSGADAKTNGLIDLFGTLDDAVAMAAERAGISNDYSVKYYPKTKPWAERLMEEIGRNAKAYMEPAALREARHYMDALHEISRYQGVQALMPESFRIQ